MLTRSQQRTSPARPVAKRGAGGHLPVPDVRRAARQVESYWHADGSARWPLRELARVLADCGGVRTRG
jgi:hypothetical protein